MDNYERRLGYAQQRYHAGADPLSAMILAGQQVSNAITAGTEDGLLTPAQRRRIRHKRGSAHRPVQTARKRQGDAVITDEAALFGDGDRIVPVIDGTRIADLVKPVSAPWAEPDADVKGDIQAAVSGGSSWDYRMPVPGLRQDEHGIVKT
jgi:hypothetical protein